MELQKGAAAHKRLIGFTCRACSISAAPEMPSSRLSSDKDSCRSVSAVSLNRIRTSLCRHIDSTMHMVLKRSAGPQPEPIAEAAQQAGMV